MRSVENNPQEEAIWQFQFLTSNLQLSTFVIYEEAIPEFQLSTFTSKRYENYSFRLIEGSVMKITVFNLCKEAL